MSHRFGGRWTEDKLDVVGRYLAAYTTALKNQPFEKLYIDAFAGTGYRDARRIGAKGSTDQQFLFPDLAASEPQALLDGSARIALKTDPRFERYVFVERDPDRCKKLEGLKSEFPELQSRIVIRQGEANHEITALTKGSWRNRRAVMFLDPYGMQVEWSTLEAIAATRSIDLWLLFPLGIGVNRLLLRSGDIPESWKHRLNVMLGTTDWYEQFYSVQPSTDLFGTDEDRVIKASNEVIGRYFNERLKTIFAGVAEKPRVLRNSVNCPLYQLCFAVSNKNGAPTALRIANHLLDEGIA